MLPRSPAAETYPSPTGLFYYDVSSISLSGAPSKVLNIGAGCDIVIRISAGTGSTGVSVSGNASIKVLAGASLELYAQAHISIGGRGIANSNDPEAFMLYSTRPVGAAGSQNISVSGNGQLSAVVYAPNTSVSMNGGGSSGNVYGAVVADSITVTGGSEFHYDEALAAMTTGNPFGVGQWAELTSFIRRATYTSIMGF